MENVIRKYELSLGTMIRKYQLSLGTTIRKLGISILLMALVLPFAGCLEEDPCNGLDPVVIAYNEPYILKLRTQDDISIFTDIYDINELVITENGDTIDFRYYKVSTDSVIQFTPKSLSAAYIWQSFETVMHTEIIFHYDSIQSDTLTIQVLPREYDTDCPRTEYATTELKFNETIIREVNNTPCITCKDTLVIKI